MKYKKSLKTTEDSKYLRETVVHVYYFADQKSVGNICQPQLLYETMEKCEHREGPQVQNTYGTDNNNNKNRKGNCKRHVAKEYRGTDNNNNNNRKGNCTVRDMLPRNTVYRGTDNNNNRKGNCTRKVAKEYGGTETIKERNMLENRIHAGGLLKCRPRSITLIVGILRRQVGKP